MLLKSKTVQLSKFIVKDYVSCEFTWKQPLNINARSKKRPSELGFCKK